MKIKILLTEHYDGLSRFVYWSTGRRYTHASIQLSESGDAFYSFNRKGFRVEQPDLWRAKDGRIHGEIFELNISRKKYRRLEAFIADIRQNSGEYRYNLLGLLLRLLSIHYREKKTYFCSEFVADGLMQAGILHRKKPSSYYLPNKIATVLKGNRHTHTITCFA